MATSIHIVKSIPSYNEFGESEACPMFQVVFNCDCVEHYPTSSKEDITLIAGGFEGIRHLETAWIETCRCGIDCNTDFSEGDYAYLMNRYWKIVGIRLYDDCGCITIKLVLERLEPRETSKALIECINCFETGGELIGK